MEIDEHNSRQSVGRKAKESTAISASRNHSEREARSNGFRPSSRGRND